MLEWAKTLRLETRSDGDGYNLVIPSPLRVWAVLILLTWVASNSTAIYTHLIAPAHEKAEERFNAQLKTFGELASSITEINKTLQAMQVRTAVLERTFELQFPRSYRQAEIDEELPAPTRRRMPLVKP